MKFDRTFRLLVSGLPAVAAARRALFLIAGFLSGQATIRFLNLLGGLLILRFLPIEQYALYTVANMLLAVGSVGSDLGVTQALISFGARVRHDPRELGAWFAAARRWRRGCCVAVAIVIVGLATSITSGRRWSGPELVGCVLLILTTVWVQQILTLRQAIFNVHSDASGLFKSGAAGALVRLVLVVALCRWWPSALLVLVVNLMAVVVADRVATWRSRCYIDQEIAPTHAQSRPLRRFVVPLIPSIVYYMIQGQSSIVLLGLFGNTASVAEVGALGSLGQVIGVIMMLNLFFVQPHFARIGRKSELAAKLAWLTLGLGAAGALVLLSAFVAPGGWLWLLGRNYQGLKALLPLTLSTAWLGAVGAVLYTILLARRATGGQVWTIVVGVAVQVVFIVAHGVYTTDDAVLLNALLAAGTALVEFVLLCRMLRSAIDTNQMSPPTTSTVIYKRRDPAEIGERS